MTLIFISGPISGHEDLNKPAFMQADEDLQDAGYMTINPFNIPKPQAMESMSAKDVWKTCMRLCIRELTRCDMIYMLAGWQNSEGSVWEFRIANMLGLKVSYQEVK